MCNEDRCTKKSYNTDGKCDEHYMRWNYMRVCKVCSDVFDEIVVVLNLLFFNMLHYFTGGSSVRYNVWGQHWKDFSKFKIP